jgi:hypothetical protein
MLYPRGGNGHAGGPAVGGGALGALVGLSTSERAPMQDTTLAWTQARIKHLVILRNGSGLTADEQVEYEDLCDVEAWLLRPLDGDA